MNEPSECGIHTSKVGVVARGGGLRLNRPGARSQYREARTWERPAIYRYLRYQPVSLSGLKYILLNIQYDRECLNHLKKIVF